MNRRLTTATTAAPYKGRAAVVSAARAAVGRQSEKEKTMQTPVDRARRAVHELLACYQEARTTNEREAIARLIACLTPSGALSLAEMAEMALQTARE